MALPSPRDRAARLRRRLSTESGFAVPTVLLMTVAALGMASVAVKTSIQGQSGTIRDQGTKSALAVAESGVSQALLHYNRGVPPCEPSVEGEWCGPVAGMAVNGGEVAYWARLANGEEECGAVEVGQCVEIVSMGSVGGVTRKVDVFALSLESEGPSGLGPFASAGVLSLESMTLDSNSAIHTGVATNGDYELKSNAEQCGPASVGIGREMSLQGNADWLGNADCDPPELDPGDAAQQELTLPPVSPGSAHEENDNHRFFELDVVNEDDEPGKVCWSGKNANGGASGNCGERELKLDSNSSLTLGGSVYSFCKLSLNSNSNLFIGAGSDVTIYFDSPENCGYQSGVRQLELGSNTELANSRITSAGGDPTNVTLLFSGSEDIQTEILLNSNTQVDGPCDQNFVIYAPLTDVQLDSNSKFCGAIAGKSIHLDSNSEIWSASGTESLELPDPGFPEASVHYKPYRFVECSPAAASPPDAGC